MDATKQSSVINRTSLRTRRYRVGPPSDQPREMRADRIQFSETFEGICTKTRGGKEPGCYLDTIVKIAVCVDASVHRFAEDSINFWLQPECMHLQFLLARGPHVICVKECDRGDFYKCQPLIDCRDHTRFGHRHTYNRRKPMSDICIGIARQCIGSVQDQEYALRWLALLKAAFQRLGQEGLICATGDDDVIGPITRIT